MAELNSSLTIEEQVCSGKLELVTRLKYAHNLVIEDKQDAMRILSRVNYSRLSAYGIGLKQKEDPERYVDGISLEHLFRLYEFDSEFRNVLASLVEHVEVGLRTQMAHYLSRQYGPEGYCEVHNFQDRQRGDGTSVHEETIDKLKHEIKNQRNQPFVKYYNRKYDGHFPIWVAIELFSFGMLTKFYSIMKPDDRDNLADLYLEIDKDHLDSWMSSLHQVRNQCAHCGRIYNMTFSQQPRLFSEHKRYRGKKIFPILIVLRRMINDPEKWASFIKTMHSLFDKYPEVNLSFIEFPKDWDEVLSAPSSYCTRRNSQHRPVQDE